MKPSDYYRAALCVAIVGTLLGILGGTLHRATAAPEPGPYWRHERVERPLERAARDEGEALDYLRMSGEALREAAPAPLGQGLRMPARAPGLRITDRPSIGLHMED